MNTALSWKQAIATSEAWSHIEKHTFFAVTNGGEFLVEAPYERQDRDQESEEAVLRVFTDHEDAWLYCEDQQENYAADDDVMHVKGITLAELYKFKEPILKNGLVDFGVAVRVDACTLREGEPIVLDTLWTSEQPTH